MKNKYVIIDIDTMDYMKSNKEIIFYDSYEEAKNICSWVEVDGAWVMKLEYNCAKG